MSGTDTRYQNSSQQRILRVLLRLGGHEMDGLAPSDIARALEVPPSYVHRDLANLRIAGIAEQLPDSKRWRLTPRIPQIAVAMLNGVEKAERRAGEVRQRYTREPR